MTPAGSEPDSLADAPLSEERLAELRAFLAPLRIEPRDWTLIDQALTHSSHAFEQGLARDNERLEFLGDAVLGLLVSLHLYAIHQTSTEGELSKFKAQLVSRNVLGRLAFDLNLGPLLRLGRGEEQTGGRRRFSLLGSALEALIGAIYLDLGLEAARGFIAPFLLNVHDTITQHEAYQDYKSQLQELVQRTMGVIPRYETIDAIGPDHDKTFFVTVTVDGRVMGTGSGSRVKSAENRAANAALERFQSEVEQGSGG
jgi:ribonuclease-3